MKSRRVPFLIDSENKEEPKSTSKGCWACLFGSSKKGRLSSEQISARYRESNKDVINQHYQARL